MEIKQKGPKFIVDAWIGIWCKKKNKIKNNR